MSSSLRFTSADLETMPDDGKLYEIIDGELCVTRQPHLEHQEVCSQVVTLIRNWNRQTKIGRAFTAPGLIFAEDDDVAPDVAWISRARLAGTKVRDGRLHIAPELIIEVLSPGRVNERRDRESKLKLYSRHGVQEYWIVDWRLRQVEIYRRNQQILELDRTLFEPDTLSSPVLPGFSCKVSELFEDIQFED